jgi:hypothetical protein
MFFEHFAQFVVKNYAQRSSRHRKIHQRQAIRKFLITAHNLLPSAGRERVTRRRTLSAAFSGWFLLSNNKGRIHAYTITKMA